jgi:hypothetical protein
MLILQEKKVKTIGIEVGTPGPIVMKKMMSPCSI